MFIFPSLYPAVAQVIEIDFGKFHVFSSLTIVIILYVAPSVEHVVAIAFGIKYVGSNPTIFIFLHVIFMSLPMLHV